MSFAKNISKNIGRNISKSLSGKHSHKPLDHGKQSATHALKTISKKVIHKIAEATGNLIGKKVSNKITRISRFLSENSSGTVRNETENTKHGKEIPKERYAPPGKWPKIIDDLKLI